jgi:hypothetical protein
MNLIYDRISGGTDISQYRRYLENEQYLYELKRSTKDAVNYQLIEVRRELQSQSDIKRAGYDKLVATVCGSLEHGFNDVNASLEIVNESLGDINRSLGTIANGIEELCFLLDWKTDQIIEQQKITNRHLNEIVELLNIPESQKQRAYHVRNGLKFLALAISEGTHSGYYIDAYSEFELALGFEPRDYFCLYKMGFIRLYSSELLDVNLALKYFEESAKYSKAEAFSAST